MQERKKEEKARMQERVKINARRVLLSFGGECLLLCSKSECLPLEDRIGTEELGPSSPPPIDRANRVPESGSQTDLSIDWRGKKSCHSDDGHQQTFHAQPRLTILPV